MSPRSATAEFEVRGDASGATHEFEASGLHVAVTSCHTPALEWLAEFFPSAIGCSPHARVEIQLVIDPLRYERNHALGPLTAGELDCFTLDGRSERHRVWSECAGYRVLHLESANAFMRIDKNRPFITMLAKADGRHLRVSLMRLVREVVTIRALLRGNLLLHASAAACDLGAVLFAGPKRAGKTSMLLNALNQKDVAFVSNDRVLVNVAEDEPVRVRGVPTIVRVRSGSLRYLPAPTPADWERSHHYSLRHREADTASACAGADGSGRQLFSMSPVQFCRWMGVEMRASSVPSAVVFPHIDERVGSFELCGLDAKEVEDRLAASTFSNQHQPQAFAGTWLSASCECTHATAISGLRRRLDDSSTSFQECRLGPSAFGDPNVWKAIVDGLRTTCR